MNEIKRLQKLAGLIKESDNEWDIKAGPEWNEHEIKINDVITNDMKNPEILIDEPSFSHHEPYNEEQKNMNDEWIISDIRRDYDGYVVVVEYKTSGDNEGWTEADFIHMLDPKKYWVLDYENATDDFM
jgi:hypothetical protein